MTLSLDTYLINLDRSVERRARMEAQLAAISLGYIRIPAVDGRARWKELSADIDIPAFERTAGRRIMHGEIGCYHSHLTVLDKIIAGSSEVALILEDDVVFGPRFKEALEAALAVQSDWDMLKLNKIRAKQPVAQRAVGRWMMYAYLGPLTGNGAYLITRAAAVRLRPALMPITRPIDHEYDRVFIHDIRHFGLEPFPSHVEDLGHSTITGAGFSGVQKFAFPRRLASKGIKIGNLVRKFLYLTWKGRVFGRKVR